MDWDEEYDLLETGGGSAGDAFVNRLRNAIPDDDDVDIPGPAAARSAPAAVPLIQLAEEETPLQQLIRHWTNERNCPDILQAQEELLVTILDHIRRQVSGFQAGLRC